MKTYKNLYDRYISEDNIIDSLRSAKRGHKSKHIKQKLSYLLDNFETEKDFIYNVVTHFKCVKHTPKEIYDGISRKKRKIIVPTAIELLVQHMVVNVLKPIFSKGMYKHTYAAIPNRGTHLGKTFLAKWIKNDVDNTQYYLKIDIRHYFESIPQDMLLKKLRRIIKDERFIAIIEALLSVTNKGLPLGFYTSQWFANWYLQDFDHFIKQELKAKYYMRYMDDAVILGGNKSELWAMFLLIQSYLTENGLEVKGNYRVSKLTENLFLDFMGFRFYSNRTTLRRSIMIKMTRAARRISRKPKATIHDARKLLSYDGWCKWCDIWNVRRRYVTSVISIRKMRRIVSQHDRRHK